ncbi:acyltransferase [Actinoplanes sp. LDG1-06]|uniref:Acyltransferase n=1 Tax=Paractinoplanes ovalisporus TaxID=2810368 RepID=A0ABS2A3U1_9ACTN|nr:acyltransferase [Actinoplanes ovalisporus]MBM2614501.1 acyltransferase [Actinoplanes ovalisporus]
MTKARRPELDAIRLFVVLGLVFFHAALVFDERDDFYVKNAQTTEATTWIAGLGVVWAMPALFLIAGLGSWHSMRRRGAGGFVRERLLRLGVPLVFATLTIIPVPQWLRLKAADPAYDESYPRFLTPFFDVHLGWSEFPFLVRGESFETGHLWFVVLLLTFALMLAAIVAWVPGGWPAWLGDRLTRRGLFLVVPAIPPAVVGALLGMEESFAGWSRWAYLLFFLYGFVLAADDRFRTAMRRDARLAVLPGILLFGASGALLSTADGDPFLDMTVHAIAARIVFALAGWFWLVAILGLLDRPRVPVEPDQPSRPNDDERATVGGDGGQRRDQETTDRTGREQITEPRPSPTAPKRGVLAYLGTAALPLYILHQPIVVAVAYFAVRWDAPMLVKYLVIVAVSFAVMFAVYDLLVRRTRPTRLLFGMR